MKIDREIATEELNGWFEKKKIRTSQQTANKDSVNTLVDALMEGDLILDKETGVFTHTLLHPDALGNSEAIKELKYKSRLNDNILKPFMEGNKSGVIDIMQSYVAALTDVQKSILSKLDTADKRICNSIAVFFM